jgi:hypothetical protein
MGFNTATSSSLTALRLANFARGLFFAETGGKTDGRVE